MDRNQSARLINGCSDTSPQLQFDNIFFFRVLVCREKMQDFWHEHSASASEEDMMLDSQAHVLGEYEIPEVLSLLPDYKAKDVLDLGAGIG